MKKILSFIAFFWVALLSSIAQEPLNSLDFDGTGDYVSIALPAIFTDLSNNDFTVETWVKPEGAATQRIFYAQSDATHFVTILLNDANIPYIYVYNGTGQGYDISNGLPLSQWSHIAVSWDASTQQIVMYVNGLVQSLISGGTSTTGTNNVLTLGSRSDGTQNLVGELDEFRIWNYARSACEIGAGMNSEYTIAQPGLIAYYQFNVGVAGGVNTGLTNLPDFTGTFNGTLHNFTLSGSTSNWVSSGAIITAVNQNGNVNTMVTQNGITLTASAVGAGYQWLDCNDNMAALIGQTSQSFTATTNGSYAVKVSQNGCVDTSLCYPITTVSIPENNSGNPVCIYPVPSTSKVTIQLEKTTERIHATLFDNNGRELLTRDYQTVEQFTIELPEPAGYYFIEISTPEGKQLPVRVIKE